MAAIRSRDSKAEMAIRRGLHARGRRFRLHGKDLPGKPDLVFPAKRAVIFVHGCFFHGHACPLFRWPATRAAFWRAKISRNICRDERVRTELLDRGWRVGEIWECALKGTGRWPIERVLDRCIEFLDGSETGTSVSSLGEGDRSRAV
jgi:DNA mismatch endonuclease (patch repair protein)